MPGPSHIIMPMNETKKPTSTNWRQTITSNHRKTLQVIAIFVLIYLALGLLVDLYVNGGFVPDRFSLVLRALLSFQIIPTFTIITVLVAMASLWITYVARDKLMLLGTEYHEVTADNAKSLEEKQLYNIIEELKLAAGMQYMPKVYVIDADYMNAFASGFSEKSAMVAITKGLIQKLSRDELEAVMAHELSHIRHGDIRLVLTASVLSNLMLIIVDILFYNVIFSRSDRKGGNNFVLIIILLRYLLPVITILLMLYLSRTREYMADAGSVELLRDNQPLGRALLKIANDHEANNEKYRRSYGATKHEDVRRAAYIFDPFTDGTHPIKSLSSLMATHPSIKDRLKALGFSSLSQL